MITGLFVPADAEKGITEIQLESYEDYQVAVDGWIEPLDLPELGVTIFVTEEGIVRKQPFNSRLSLLWWYLRPETRSDILVGDAVIVGNPNEHGINTNVPREVSELLTRPRECVILVRLSTENIWRYVPRAGNISEIEALPVASDAGSPATTARYEDVFAAVARALVLVEGMRGTAEIQVVPVIN